MADEPTSPPVSSAASPTPPNLLCRRNPTGTRTSSRRPQSIRIRTRRTYRRRTALVTAHVRSRCTFWRRGEDLVAAALLVAGIVTLLHGSQLSERTRCSCWASNTNPTLRIPGRWRACLLGGSPLLASDLRPCCIQIFDLLSVFCNTIQFD